MDKMTMLFFIIGCLAGSAIGVVMCKRHLGLMVDDAMEKILDYGTFIKEIEDVTKIDTTNTEEDGIDISMDT